MIPSLGPGALVASRYEILSLLGTGGMGVVYKAHDRSLDDVVALKVLRTGADLDLVRRFRSEVKLARKVRHKNVCAIHDYGEDGERLYISMEYVEGTDLKRLLHDQGAFFWEDAYDYALQVGEGLRAIHEAGVIHRDLKPANVMKDLAGIVRVMDFGIAKLGVGGAPDLTGEGKVVGSPEYMSPEQVRGGAGLDFRSDLYSLGILIYELFAGHVPFRAEDAFATMRKQLFEEPSLEDSEGSTFPPALVPVLRKALAKSPEDRPSSCAALIDALRAAREALGEQSTDEVPPPSSSGHTPTRLVPGLARKSPQQYPPQARLLIPTLVRALKSPDAEVRLGAAAALGRTPDESVRPALAAAFVTEVDSEVRRRVGEVLQTLDVPAVPRVAIAPEVVSPLPAGVVAERPGPPSPPRDERPTADIERPIPLPHVPPPAPVVAPAPRAAPPVPVPPLPPPVATPPTPVAEPRPVPAPPVPAPPRRAKPAPPRALRGIGAILVLSIVVGLWWWRSRERVPVPASTAGALEPSPPVTPEASASRDALPETSPGPLASVTPAAPIGWSPAPSVPAGRLPAPKPVSGPLDATRAGPPSAAALPGPAAEAARAGTDLAPTTTLAALLETPAPPLLVVSPPTPETAPPPTEPAAPPRDEPPVVAEPGVDPPVCVRCPGPDYPPMAARFKRGGTVVLRALIDESGRVADVVVIQGVQWLTEAAVTSVRKRTYRPATRQGVPVKAWIEVPIRFDVPK